MFYSFKFHDEKVETWGLLKSDFFDSTTALKHPHV